MMSPERYRPDQPDQPVVEAIGSLTTTMAQLVQAVRDLRQEPSLPEQLAQIWEQLAPEDQQQLVQLALRLRNTRHEPPNSQGGAGS
jgi:hypothetical protein